MFSHLVVDEGSPSGLIWKDTAYHLVRGKPAGSKDSEGYWVTGVNRKIYKNHRIILQLLGVSLQEGDCVDHIDGNPSNNNPSNLRVATSSENSWNSKIPVTNTSGFKGVYSHGTRWRAKVQYKGQRYHLGVFNTPEEAHLVVQQKRKELHHEFARD